MQKLHCACAILGTALSAAAQCAAGSSAPPQSLLLVDPFTANFYVGSPSPVPAGFTGFNLLFDLDASCDITLTGLETWLYDDGAVNPDQLGNSGVVNVYTCPNSYIGNEQTLPGAAGSPWTLAGSGNVVVAMYPANSVITLNAPISITQGNYGVAVEFQPPTSGTNPGPLHPLIESPNANPTPGDLFIDNANMAIQPEAFVGASFNDGINLQLDYTPSPAAAFAEQFGDGCYFRPRPFFEDFAPNTFDLANSEITMIPSGPNYTVVPGGSSYIAPTSASLTLNAPPVTTTSSWDDALSSPITLPFTFPYVGGTTTQTTTEITISSNGNLFLGAVTDSSRCFAYYNSLADFREYEPRLAPFWGDLDPSVSGGIHYDQISSNEVRITWVAVEEWGVPGPTSTLQVVLDSSGGIQYIYGNISQTVPTLTGFTPGNDDRLPVSQDLSATMPFQSGDGAIPPVLDVSSRPVLGQSFNWFLSGITSGTPAVFLVTGTGAIPGGQSLAFIQMPGCFQYIVPQNTFFMNLDVPTLTATTPLTVPNNPIFVGANLFAQAAPFTPGLNGAGILTSNGACITVGTQ